MARNEQPASHTILDGVQEIRRDEGLTFTVDTENWGGSPTSPSVTVTRCRDGSDVTSDFIPSGSPSVTDDVITLPEITAPSAAQLGDYIVSVQFDSGGFGPGIAWFALKVYE